jgi:hypothetical protein
VALGVVSVIAQIWATYKSYVAFLKWLTLLLCVAALAVVKVPWSEALWGLSVPAVKFDAAFLTTLVLRKIRCCRSAGLANGCAEIVDRQFVPWVYHPIKSCAPKTARFAMSSAEPVTRAQHSLTKGNRQGIDTMKIAMGLVTAAVIGVAVPANAEDARIGVGVGPVGAGVTVGESHDRDRDRDRTTIIRRDEEPRDKTVIIRKEHREPENKVIIRDHDRD